MGNATNALVNNFKAYSYQKWTDGMISEKEAEGIVVKDLRRISRDLYKLFSFEAILKENGAKLIDSKLGVLDYSKGVNPVYERR